MLAKVPTAPEIAQVDISLIEFSKRFLFLRKILDKKKAFLIQMLLVQHVFHDFYQYIKYIYVLKPVF